VGEVILEGLRSSSCQRFLRRPQRRVYARREAAREPAWQAELEAREEEQAVKKEAEPGLADRKSSPAGESEVTRLAEGCGRNSGVQASVLTSVNQLRTFAAVAFVLMETLTGCSDREARTFTVPDGRHIS